MMHVPSFDEDTISVLNLLKQTLPIEAVCSFRTPTKLCRIASIFHTRTWPSTPPLTKIFPQLEIVNAEQPLLCALGIA